MSVPHISYKMPTPAIRGEIRFSGSQLKAYPWTADLAPRFDDALARWQAMNSEELGLLDAEEDADAHAVRVDGDIDPLVDKISRALLDAVDGDRTDPQYRRFFGRRRPSEIRRPILSAELSEVREWVPSLRGSTIATLPPLGELLSTLVVEADAAEGEQARVDREWEDFGTSGTRRRFIDELNQLRADTYGELIKRAAARGESPDFVERFFKHDRRQYRAPAEPTLAEAKARQAELRGLLAEQDALVARLEAEERERQEAKARRQADEAALAELERQAEELRQRLRAANKK